MRSQQPGFLPASLLMLRLTCPVLFSSPGLNVCMTRGGGQCKNSYDILVHERLTLFNINPCERRIISHNLSGGMEYSEKNHVTNQSSPWSIWHLHAPSTGRLWFLVNVTEVHNPGNDVQHVNFYSLINHSPIGVNLASGIVRSEGGACSSLDNSLVWVPLECSVEQIWEINFKLECFGDQSFQASSPSIAALKAHLLKLTGIGPMAPAVNENIVGVHQVGDSRHNFFEVANRDCKIGSRYAQI